MLGIMDKELKFENIPYGYSVCFNGDCALRETCMHYLAGQLQPANRYSGHAIYPMAWKSGTCQSYREKKLVKKAWGFSQLYKNVPYYQRAEARQCVRSYFSSGNGPYYRYHHGENTTAIIMGRICFRPLSRQIFWQSSPSSVPSMTSSSTTM